MKISWKLKSFIFRLIDFFDVPNFLYFLQKHITGRSRIETLDISKNWVAHKDCLVEHGIDDKVFEFGAGKNLAQNLFLSNFVNNQIVVDLYPMIDINSVERAREGISNHITLKSNVIINSKSDLKEFGIQYIAPFNAAFTGFDEKSLGACISTNTLEHIPKDSIFDIFQELFRVLKDGGIVSAIIDYSDHYAHTDKSISLLNYLKYDEKEWEKYNHKCHFQNRLRHNEYIEIFCNCGFKVIKEKLFFDELNIPKDLEINFKDKDRSWKATHAHIVLQR